jgi:ethanolamine utilization microcompartment shell protein EutS
VPPWRTISSETSPNTGLAVTPDQPSLPPHSSASISSEIGCGVRATRVDLWQQALDRGNPSLHSLADAALILNHQQRCALVDVAMTIQRQLIVIHQVTHLVHFAAQPHQDVCTDIGVARHSGQGALQKMVAGVAHFFGAANAVREGDHAIYIGEGSQLLFSKVVGQWHARCTPEQFTVEMMAM